MSIQAKRGWTFGALIAVGVAVGIVLASSANWTPRSDAQRPSAPAAAPGRPSYITIPSFADIASRAMPSVVSITAVDIVKGRGNLVSPFGEDNDGSPFQFFFGFPPDQNHGSPQEHKEEAGGSGFIISPDGYILTNNHVVANSTKIEVKVNEAYSYRAKIVGTDPATDLALLKIDAKEKLTPISLGDSDKLRVGDWVMAIGDPWSFDRTVTVGVVSAKGRHNLSTDPNENSFENFIQTDAAINFGNSGGPLLDVDGDVVGINTAIYRPAQNIGFAIPINTAKSILSQLKTRGKVVRGFLGVNIRNIDEDTMKGFSLPSMDGTLVESVETGTPAGKAGIRHGDVIVKVDDVAVKSSQDLIDYVAGKAPGATVRLTVWRDGKTQVLPVVLGERKPAGTQEASDDSSGSSESSQKIGISVQDLTPQTRQYFRISPDASGALIVNVKEVSPAGDAGLAAGDVITEVNGKAVRSASELSDIVRKARKGDYLRFYVRRFRPQPVSFYAIVKVGD